MSVKKFLQSSAFLAMCGLVSKVIGALFKVPLTNILGVEGMGIYLMVFPIYTVLLALSSGGLPQAVSKHIASVSPHRRHDIIKSCIVVFAIIGGIGTVLMCVLASSLANLQGNSMATGAYITLSISVLCVSVIAVLRGYFQGKQNYFPTALSGLIEQLAKLVFGIYFAIKFLPLGLSAGVAGGLLGVSLSEILALLYLGIEYYLDSFSANRAMKRLYTISTKKNVAGIVKCAVPISLGGLILPLSQLIDSVLIVNLLKFMGYSTSYATSMYGIVMSPIATLINVPTVFASAIAVAIIPSIAKVLSNDKKAEDCGDKSAVLIERIVAQKVKQAVLISVLCCAGLVVTGKVVLEILYPELSASQLVLANELLMISTINIFFISIITVTSGVLTAVGRQNLPAINLLIGGVVKVAGTIVFVLAFGIYGMGISSVLSYACIYVLNYIGVKRHMQCHILKSQLLALLCGVVAIVCGLIFNALIDLPKYLAFLLSGSIVTVAYAITALLTKTIDIKRWYFGKKRI